MKNLCLSNADFQRSIWIQRKIEVWIVGEFEVVGNVKYYDNECVKIDGNYYCRENCEFVMVDEDNIE